MNLKKGAMFSLFGALKKQSGRLFLATRHSVDSQETRGSVKTNRGAMFGLDARIALAIFGALSVISGAALYSAIQQAKVIAIVAELNEVGKAYEQYMLDTGSDLVLNSGNPTHMEIDYLVVDSGVAGWKGPYLSYEIDTSTLEKDRLKHPLYDLVLVVNSTTATWGGSVGQKGCAADCTAFARLNKVPLSLAEAVDEYIDGTKDDDEGLLRIYRLSADDGHVYMQIGPTLR